MEMQASASRKSCITKTVRKLTLTAQFPGEEVDLAQLFKYIRQEGIGEILWRCGKHAKETTS